MSQLPFDKLVQFTARATKLTAVLRAEQVAAYTVFVYDWLLTLKTEREVFAGSSFTPVKLAYLFARYWPLVMHPVTLWTQVTVSDARQCEDIFRRPLYLTTFNFVGAALVLLVRLYAFNGSRALPVLALAAAMIGVVVFQLYVAATKTMLAPFAPACFPTDKQMGSRWLSGYFLAPLMWDMLTMVVFIYTAVQQRLRLTNAKSTIRVFVNEGLLYFFAITSVHGVNTILSYQGDIVISGSLVPMSMILPNLLACRLVINLRQSAVASTRSLETENEPEPTYPIAHRGVVHVLPLPIHHAGGPRAPPTKERPGTGVVSSHDASGWFSGSTTFQTTSTGVTFANYSQAHGAVPPLPSSSSDIRPIRTREFVHVRRDGKWETFSASMHGSEAYSLGVRTESGTGSYYETTSSFTGTAGSRSGTSSFTGTAYRSEDGSMGQMFLAPPVERSARWHWSPRFKLLGYSSSRREPSSASTSSALPQSTHQSSVFTSTASNISNSSTVPPAQLWDAGYLNIEPPTTPLRQRLPSEAVGVARPRAESDIEDRPRLATVAEMGGPPADVTNVGYSSTFSPRFGAASPGYTAGASGGL